VDDCTDEERLAASIGLSLRNMDINVEQIAEFYHEQLTDIIASAAGTDKCYGGMQDHNLFAHVHSFFVHAGAARDYLATFIAARLGMEIGSIDSMARLISASGASHFAADNLLNSLKSRGLAQLRAARKDDWELTGWLKDLSDLRNRFVHRRPYGSHYIEAYGRVVEIAPEQGLYRYVRPVQIGETAKRDILDLIVENYREITALFLQMAKLSGNDTAMLRISDKDIISADVEQA
jgi:hypothetical protein